ncbi:MAG: peptidoglycan DD-metalloendopeptidase family protein [Clostridiales bacterium]|jgi:murein DD-endopeptidase MepM/ murein hydrolase activator NlpD|nr:peptidoglycan DD-metalloendopeptidase family protein [Clostridiales bacterium]
MRRNIFLLLALASLVATTLPVRANSLEDLKNKQEEVNSEKSEVQEEFNSTIEQKNQAEVEMEQIDSELTKATDDLILLNDRLDRTNILLEKIEGDLSAAQEEREKQYDTLKKRMRYMYINGTIDYLDVIFDAQNFTDFVNRVEYINRIIKNDKTLVNKLVTIESVISEKVKEIDNQKSNIEVMAFEQEQLQTNLQDALAKKQEVFNKLDSDEKSYAEKIASLDKAEAEIVSLIKAAEADAARKEAARQAAAALAASGGYASTSVNAAPYSGQMLWPVPGRYTISDVYRYRYNPVNGRSEFHSGVDIPAPTGTSIVAADNGVCIYAGWKSGYGYTIIVDHGNGITTLYGHNSKTVASSGTIVNKGDVIARAGSTGNSTGPHCHFEVRINGSPTNPKAYLNY